MGLKWLCVISQRVCLCNFLSSTWYIKVLWCYSLFNTSSLTVHQECTGKVALTSCVTCGSVLCQCVSVWAWFIGRRLGGALGAFGDESDPTIFLRHCLSFVYLNTLLFSPLISTSFLSLIILDFVLSLPPLFPWPVLPLTSKPREYGTRSVLLPCSLCTLWSLNLLSVAGKDRSKEEAFIKHFSSPNFHIPFFLLYNTAPLSLSLCPPSLAGWPPCLSPLAPTLLWPWPWPCPPWVIYHGPGGEPPGLQAPVSPCNRLFVAPSKQVSDQQKSIKAWWAFLSQLGSGHWAALLAAPRALCVAAVRWHRSPQD